MDADSPCAPYGLRTLRQAYEALDVFTGGEPTVMLDRRERFLAMRYDGVSFGDHRIRYRKDDPEEIDYEKGFGEAISFGHLAVALGIDGDVVDVENLEPPAPDLRVSFSDGRHVLVEVGQVTASESARYAAGIAKTNRLLRRRESSDADYRASIKGFTVFIQIEATIASRDVRLVADEIVRIASGFDAMPRKTRNHVDPSLAPLLAALNARIWIGEGNEDTHVRADSTAYFFNPNESAELARQLLNLKMDKTYEVDASLWLALALTDPRQVPSLSMDVISSNPPASLGQFERVLIGTMQSAHLFE